MDDAARPVGENLHLDMARPRQEALEIDLIVAEEGLGFGSRCEELALECRFLAHDAHAAPTAARSRLDEQGIADAERRVAGACRIEDAARRAGDDGNPQL